MPKNYFAIVHKETGEFPVLSGELPIYWRKDVATKIAKDLSNFIVQPVDAEEFKRLILSKPNKKAR
jgi:hypothetical protein